MGGERVRLKKRKAALTTLDTLMQQQGVVNCIHYSCESFYDRRDGRSARITSIAVRNLETAQTTSFSIHMVAERLKYSPDRIETQYDELEKQMLSEFYSFVQHRNNCKWLHWNMRDVNYGFPALDHRFRVLGGIPTHISEANLYDLAAILIDIYGPGYIGHPRLEKLIDKNKISRLSFLSGADEADAFITKSYVKLHQSTLRKVDIMANIAERAWDETLKTNSTWKDKYGTTLVGMVEAATDHWFYKVLGFIGIIASLISLAPMLLPKEQPESRPPRNMMDSPRKTNPAEPPEKGSNP